MRKDSTVECISKSHFKGSARIWNRALDGNWLLSKAGRSGIEHESSTDELGVIDGSELFVVRRYPL